LPEPQAPNQFQRFVQDSTGQLLPVFGSKLFDNPQAYAADNAAPAPGEYVLGPGDEVRIQIWGATDFAGTQTLDRNGQINLPKIGNINLAGVQVKDLEPTLRKQIATVLTNVSVNASLGKLRGITVYVVGQARQPGTYNLSSLSTLVNAVFASGGPGNQGSMRKIELKRGGKTVTTLDLYDFIAKGDKSKDAALQPGDVISIPPAGPRMAPTTVPFMSWPPAPPCKTCWPWAAVCLHWPRPKRPCSSASTPRAPAPRAWCKTCALTVPVWPKACATATSSPCCPSARHLATRSPCKAPWPSRCATPMRRKCACKTSSPTAKRSSSPSTTATKTSWCKTAAPASRPRA
jgi:protein involved in polysaccharide export with SLBB domain